MLILCIVAGLLAATGLTLDLVLVQAVDDALLPRIPRPPASVTPWRLVHEAEDARNRSKVIIGVSLSVTAVRDLPDGFELLGILLDHLPGDAGGGVRA